jgi:hypothetical protein
MGYLALCLAGLVAGLMLQGAGVALGGWIAVAAGIALMPIFVPFPEREDLPVLLAGAAVAVPGALVLRAVDAPGWTSRVLIGVVALVVIVIWVRRDTEPRSGQVRIPPGFRFGSRKR